MPQFKVSLNMDEIRRKLPVELHEVWDQYGNAMISSGADEVGAWVDQLIRGNHLQAYKRMLTSLDNQKLISEGDNIIAGFRAAQDEGVARKEASQEMITKLFRTAMKMVVAQVGLSEIIVV